MKKALVLTLVLGYLGFGLAVITPIELEMGKKKENVTSYNSSKYSFNNTARSCSICLGFL